MKIVKKFIINPCGPRGTCLVKAACTMKNDGQFFRKGKCPDFKKYYDKNDKIENFITVMTEFFWVIVILLFFIWIVVTFVLGLFEGYHYIKQFINFVRGT